MNTFATRPPLKTIGDLLRRIGDIAPDRVRFVPAPGTATRDDLLKPENEGCELVEGTLVERPVGQEESFLAMSLGTIINNCVIPKNLGYVTGESCFYELPGGTVRGPDLSFTSWDRLPGRRRPSEPIPLDVPNLVIEVLSPSNTKREMALKREEYFHGGVQLVWGIDPLQRTLRVYTSVDQFRDLTAADTVTGDPVLPGLSIRLGDLFAESDRHG
jgi:Uma2 family endonuclease